MAHLLLSISASCIKPGGWGPVPHGGPAKLNLLQIWVFRPPAHLKSSLSFIGKHPDCYWRWKLTSSHQDYKLLLSEASWPPITLSWVEQGSGPWILKSWEPCCSMDSMTEFAVMAMKTPFIESLYKPDPVGSSWRAQNLFGIQAEKQLILEW